MDSTPRRSAPPAFQQSLKRSMEAAWAEAAAAEGGSGSKVFQAQIVGDLWPPLFMHGSMVLLERRPIESVRPGQFVLVRENGQLRVTRFLDWSFTSGGIEVQIKVDPNTFGRESYSARDIVGAIVAVRQDGKDVDPHKESPFARLGNALTDFGTATPLAKMARMAREMVHSVKTQPKKQKPKGMLALHWELLKEHRQEQARLAALRAKSS